MSVLEYILVPFNFISGLGASVMMPIIVTLLGCILGAPFGRALRAGLTVGVGFVGLNLVIGMLGGNLGPAAQAMSANFGLSLDVMDVGWPAAAAIAFGSKVGVWIIPVGILVNIIMLLTNTTATLNIDIWNYWHFAFTGAMIQVATGNLILGILAAALNMVIIMVIGDMTAPGLEKYNGLPGISLPHGFTAAFVPIAIVMDKLLAVIPGLNKIEINMDSVQKRFGVFGEPMIIGTLIGIVIGALACVNATALPNGNAATFTNILAYVLGLGITMGAALVLIPKMAAMLMEGLIPVSDAAQVFIEKRFKNRGKLYIGLDSAVGIGHPVALTCALILVPLSLLLAVVLPGNRLLPFADLAVIPFVIVLIIPVTKANFFRSFVCGLFVMAVMLYVGTDLAEVFTQTAIASSFDVAAGQTISSICDGSNPMTWAMFKLVSNLGYIGLAILAVIAVAMAVWNRKVITSAAKSEAA